MVGKSLPPREAWIEITVALIASFCIWSLPPREAWIEIIFSFPIACFGRSLPPREAWIEIFSVIGYPLSFGRRFPRGKRGLKYRQNGLITLPHKSLPPREAWIEIFKVKFNFLARLSLPPREAWIEILRQAFQLQKLYGRFPRGKRGLKWNTDLNADKRFPVASPAGSVD